MTMIHSKMIAIMRNIGAIDKNRVNQGQKYNFRGIDDVYNALHDIMSAEGVYCSIKVLEQNQVERVTKAGGAMFYTTTKVEYSFYAEDGSNVAMVATGEGMDTGDKSNLKSLSNAHKACLLQAFLIPTQDKKDTEDDNHDVQPQTDAPPTITCAELIAKIKEAKALKHLANVWDKYAPDMAKMTETEQALCAKTKNDMKESFKAVLAGDGELPDMPPEEDPA